MIHLDSALALLVLVGRVLGVVLVAAVALAGYMVLVVAVGRRLRQLSHLVPRKRSCERR
jgi:hypothetical protein